MGMLHDLLCIRAPQRTVTFAYAVVLRTSLQFNLFTLGFCMTYMV